MQNTKQKERPCCHSTFGSGCVSVCRVSNPYLVFADVVDRIVELLREQGDKLNEEVSSSNVVY